MYFKSVWMLFFGMKIKKVILDWSGVISNDMKAVYECNMQIVREHGKPTVTFEEWRARSVMTAAEDLRNYGIEGTDEELMAHYGERIAAALKQFPPTIYPDVPETLQQLRGKNVELSVLSSHPQKSLDGEAKRYRIAKYFDRIVGGATDKVAGIRSLCDGHEPTETVYAGDTIYDIRAAKGAGVLSAAIFTGYHSEERLYAEKPNFPLRTFSELDTLLTGTIYFK